jgi:hypothetical protein
VSVRVCSRNLKGGGQGPIWVVVPLDGWICIIVEYIIFFSVINFAASSLFETKQQGW